MNNVKKTTFWDRVLNAWNVLCGKSAKKTSIQLGVEIKRCDRCHSSGWRSVKDELPVKGNRVLCYYKHQHEYVDVIAENVYEGEGKWMIDGDCVTHWMPLPMPPRKEREGNV